MQVFRGVRADQLFSKNVNPRRHADTDAPALPLKTYTTMMASRAEYSIRSDWDLFPAIWSLNFASEVNTLVSKGLQRCLRRGTGAVDGMTDRDISVATGRLYELLLKGEY